MNNHQVPQMPQAMTMQEIHAQRKYLFKENRKYGVTPRMIDPAEIPEHVRDKSSRKIKAVFRSCDYLITVYQEAGDMLRLSICRTSIDDNGHFVDGISWEELQRLKNECGYWGFDAVEVYPKAGDEVDVARMRHIWILPNLLSFAWRANPAPVLEVTK